jgi:hypothetical protein
MVLNQVFPGNSGERSTLSNALSSHFRIKPPPEIFQDDRNDRIGSSTWFSLSWNMFNRNIRLATLCLELETEHERKRQKENEINSASVGSSQLFIMADGQLDCIPCPDGEWFPSFFDLYQMALEKQDLSGDGKVCSANMDPILWNLVNDYSMASLLTPFSGW